MTLRLLQSRSGAPTAMVGDVYLHSRYDPVTEAIRFVHNLQVPDLVDFFILLEPGLGYCIPYLKKNFPDSKLLIVHVSDEYRECTQTHDTEAFKVWYPDNGIDLLEFLEQAIPEGTLCQLIEWKPSATAYSPVYEQLLNVIQQFLEREAANMRTTAGFGRRWLKNVFKNLAAVQHPLTFEAGHIPVIVAGAGPSLEDTILLIQKALQEGPLCIIAAASAVPALLAHNIRPSLSVATDGGTWAAFHLIDQIRHAGSFAAGGANPLPFPLAVTLNAKLCSQAAQVPQLLISDGSLWQARLLQKLGLPYLQLPQRGTVSATLIDLALLLSTGPVYITGMDMAHQDLKTHARPYGLDFYLDEKVSRLYPRYSLSFKRALIDANQGALAIYAAWFERYFLDKRDRVRVLGRKHPRFSMLAASETIRWDTYQEPAFYMLPKKNSSLHQGPSDLVSLLIDVLQNTSDTSDLIYLQQELSYLFTGNKKAFTIPEIIKNLAVLFNRGE